MGGPKMADEHGCATHIDSNTHDTALRHAARRIRYCAVLYSTVLHGEEEEEEEEDEDEDEDEDEEVERGGEGERGREGEKERGVGG